MGTRLRWLDLARSAALLGMIVYHGAFDLQEFYGWDLDVAHGAWKVFQVIVASTFLAVSGISAGFWTRSNAAAKGWKRGWTILSAAMLVSLVTAIVDPGMWVRFGILHLIAVAAFVLPLLPRKHPLFVAALGVACIVAHFYVRGIHPNTSLFLPLGVMPPPFSSVDYVPIFPWLGPVLLGFAAGIPIATRSWNAPKPSRVQDALALPGKYSLWIYLIHQPVLMAILWAIMYA